MENPKYVHGVLAGFIITGSLGCIGLSLLFWTVTPVAVWGLFLAVSAVVLTVFTVIYGLTV